MIEIIRCLSAQNKTNSSDEIFNATKEYNNTIHSITKEKPINVKQNPNKYPEISDRILKNQKILLKYHNKNKVNRTFQPDEIIFVKSDRRRKDADAYKKHIVKEDLGDSIMTTRNKKFHKDDIRINKDVQWGIL